MHEIGLIFASQVDIVRLFLQSHLHAEYIWCRCLTIVTNRMNLPSKSCVIELVEAYPSSIKRNMMKLIACYAALFLKILFLSQNSYLEVLGLFSPNHHVKQSNLRC